MTVTEQTALVAPGRFVGVIGAGVMGQTLMRGLLSAGLLTRDQIWAADRSADTRDAVRLDLGVNVTEDYYDALPKTDLVLLCVKPAQVATALATARDAAPSESTLFISILAGVTTGQLESALALPNPWVRAMPNTPCVVGEGMTVVCRGRDATAAHLDLAQRIFAAVGRCEVVEEQYCNAITALSGSGPAYAFYFLEALEDSARELGFTDADARKLAYATFAGAIKLAQASDLAPATLRAQVTSKGGTTERAISVLDERAVKAHFVAAVKAAAARAKELGDEQL